MDHEVLLMSKLSSISYRNKHTCSYCPMHCHISIIMKLLCNTGFFSLHMTMNTFEDFMDKNDWLIDWLIRLCFTPYRQYFSHMTASTIRYKWSVLKFWGFPDCSHELTFHRNPVKRSWKNNIHFYYTSEEFFYCKTTVDKWAIQYFTSKMNYKPVDSFFFNYTSVKKFLI